MNIEPTAAPHASAYFLEDRHDPEEAHTLAVLVDNEPGVLARVIGLFSGRGYNIESLTVSETHHAQHLSRITIVTSGTRAVLEQIRNQLDRLVSVHRVTDLTVMARLKKEDKPLERELALVKVAGRGEARIEALRLADALRAEVVEAGVARTGPGRPVVGWRRELPNVLRIVQATRGLAEIADFRKR